MERFLPDAQQRYVLPNVKASDWYRTYNNFVPAYLRDRPRSVVLHCMNRQSRGNKYTDKDLSLGEGEGIFLIQKKDGSQQVVNFGKNSQDNMPSCSCKDWMKWHLPCKHFFAVFKLKEAWDWNALPAKYLNSAYLSTDNDATNAFFESDQLGVDIQSIPSTVNVPNSDVESTVEIPKSDVESTVEIPNQATLLQQPIPVKVINYNNYVINFVMYDSFFMQGPPLQALARSTRALLHQIETLTYTVTENERQVLLDLNDNLKQLYGTTYDKLPKKDGIALRPLDQRQVINKRRRVWKAKVLMKSSSLPHIRSKKRAPSSFRNCYGIKADRHRLAYQVYARGLLSTGRELFGSPFPLIYPIVWIELLATIMLMNISMGHYNYL